MSTLPGGLPGRIAIISGCIFAGKTARLIQHLTIAAAKGRRVVAFKHELDDRYDPRRLVTHDGRAFPADAVRSADLVLRRSAAADVVGIDEAQFFGRDLIAVCRELEAAGRDVFVAGLDHDAWGQPFPPLPELRELATHVEVLHTRCAVCGAVARFSQRIAPIIGDDMVGGPGEYEPRCEDCFEPLATPAPVYI